MASELAPIVRFLAFQTRKWMGCGFLVPGPPGDTNIHVMTCAHVIAAALGDKDLHYKAEKPDATVTVHFSGAAEQFVKPVEGKVVAWKPSPTSIEHSQEAYDIAVVRLSTAERPKGVDYPAFREDLPVRTEVMAHGPRSKNDLTARADGWWAEGRVRGRPRQDKVAFLAEQDIPEDKVIPGYSGGPLTVISSLEVVGMVRARAGKTYRTAIALPLKMLSSVWPHLNVGVKQSHAAARQSRILDLIDRNDQVSDVTRHLRDKLTLDDSTTKPPKMIFTVAGGMDQDHKRLGRRICLELGTYHMRPLGQSVDISNVFLLLRRGKSAEDSLDMMLEELSVSFKAPGITPQQLAYAMDCKPGGWLVQLLLKKTVSEEEATLLELFLEQWIKISDAATCETYLALSFGYDPETSPDVHAAKVHRRLQSHSADPIEVTPLNSISRTDLEEWPEDLVRHGHLDDYDSAERIARTVKRLIPEGSSVSMEELMYEIDNANLNLKSFLNPPERETS